MRRKLSSALLLLPLLAAAASAYEWRVGESTNAMVVPAGERFESEALLAAYHLDVAADAARDLWLFAAGSARWNGAIGGDLRAFASAATLAGTVDGNLFSYAKGLQLATNSIVRGEAALFGTDLICEGAVGGDARIFARSVTLGGTWGGDVRVDAEEIRVAPGTRIAGDLVYAAPKPLALDASVTVGGTVAAAPRLPQPAGARPARFALHGYLFLAALLVGMPFVGFCPLTAGGAVRQLRAAPFKALLAGLAALFGGPFLIAFAFSTVVGIPLGLLLAALYGGLFYLAHVVVALWLGHGLLRTPGPQTFARVLSALAVGLFLLYFAAALPGVAAFLAVPVLVLGGGALTLAALHRPIVFPPPLPRSRPPPVPRDPEPPA
ncbi:MAG: hypothetical protein AB7V22_07725 [Kiritimatiellia bacterium]